MAPLRSLLEPRSIVLIGGSSADDFGKAVYCNLLGSRLQDGIFLVGSDWLAADASRSYAHVAELPITPDLAIICTGAETAGEAIDQAGQKGIKTAVVIASDPRGSDQATPFKKALRDAARRSGCRFLGPGSVGVNMPAVGVNASWTGTPRVAGKLALVSQSGSVAAGVLEWATSRAIGLSRVISMGDEADIGLNEVIDYLAADIRTTGILLYLRRLTAGRAFSSSARAAARIKPILVLKPRLGPSSSRIQEPLLDEDEVYDAVFRRTGLLRVNDTAEWFDAAESVSRARPRRSGKLAILANCRGAADLAAVPTAAEGLLASFQEKTIATLTKLLPLGMPVTNPLALAHDATADHYANALAAMRDDLNIAAVVVIYASTPSNSSEEVAQVIAKATTQFNMNVSACWFGGAIDERVRMAFVNANIALYDMPEKAARAFIHLDRHRRNQEALRQIPASRRQQLFGSATLPVANGAASQHALQSTDEKESAAFLTAYAKVWRAIKSRRALLEDDESIEVLRGFGFLTPQPTDPSDPPLPLLLSIVNNSVFGRIILIRAAYERRVILPPLNDELTLAVAANVQSALRLATNIEVKTELLQNNLIRLADMAVELPEIVKLETSSIGMCNDDLIIRGARIQVAAPERAGNHLSIHPYPRELEERTHLKGGQGVLMRPMKTEDIRLYHFMLNSIPEGDLFLRFCSHFGDLTQAIPTELLANLIHFDYSRDMTFIAVGAGSAGQPQAFGLVDAFISPGREQAEFSILVRSDMAGTGLGKALMAKIIDYCRAQGVTSLFGLVLKNNSRMLGLCARLGFAKLTDDHDDDMVKVFLSL